MTAEEFDAELARRTEAELRAQGLTPVVADPAVLAQVANLLGARDERERERRLADVQRELANVELRIRLDVPELHRDDPGAQSQD